MKSSLVAFVALAMLGGCMAEANTSSRSYLSWHQAGAVGGGMAEANTSSRSYLTPEQSGAVASRDATSSAHEVTRLFEVRGYSLVDQHEEGAQLVLKYTKGNR